MNAVTIGVLLSVSLALPGCSSLQQAPAPNDTVTRNLNEMKVHPRPPVIVPDERDARIAALTKQLSEREAELARGRQEAVDLSAARRRIADLEQQLGARDRELASFRSTAGSLEAANRRLGELENQLSDRDRELSTLRQGAGNLSDANRRIGELENQLAARDRELASLRQSSGELAAANRKASDLERQLAERDAEIGRLRQAANDRDRLTTLMTASATDLEETKRRLAEQAKRLDDLNGKLSERDQELARLNALVEKGKSSENELARSRQQLASLSGTLSERDQEILRLRGQLDRQRAEKDLVKALQPEIKAGNVKVTQAADRLTIKLAAAALFDSGKEELNPAGADVLKRVGGILKEFPEQAVHVAGHTDNRPIRSALKKTFPSNKELSEARAIHAAKILENSGVSPSSIAAEGHADTQPVADNRTEEGRSKNRRVEIVVSAK